MPLHCGIMRPMNLPTTVKPSAQTRFVPTKGMVEYLTYLAEHPDWTPAEIIKASGYRMESRSRWRRLEPFRELELAMRLDPDVAAAWLLRTARPKVIGHALAIMEAGHGRTSIDAANLLLRECHAQQANRDRSKFLQALEAAISQSQG
jgi:hypothetical protein